MNTSPAVTAEGYRAEWVSEANARLLHFDQPAVLVAVRAAQDMVAVGDAWTRHNPAAAMTPVQVAQTRADRMGRVALIEFDRDHHAAAMLAGRAAAELTALAERMADTGEPFRHVETEPIVVPEPIRVPEPAPAEPVPA